MNGLCSRSLDTMKEKPKFNLDTMLFSLSLSLKTCSPVLSCYFRLEVKTYDAPADV